MTFCSDRVLENLWEFMGTLKILIKLITMENSSPYIYHWDIQKKYMNIYKLLIILEFSIKRIPHAAESYQSLINFIEFGASRWEIFVIFDVDLAPSPLKMKSNV